MQDDINKTNIGVVGAGADIDTATDADMDASVGASAGAGEGASEGAVEGVVVSEDVVVGEGAGASTNAGVDSWDKLHEDIGSCHLCGLCETRTNVVVGRGSRNGSILFIGEGPGEQEDQQGLPFVGRAGQLLDFALDGLAFPADSYYIANIVKCRPPGNRAPTDEEASFCLPYLRRQTRLLSPKIIICLGAVAVRHIIGREYKITQIRGEWIERKGIFIMPTFHPAALLRDDNKKPLTWQDLKKAKQKLNDLKQM